MIISIIIWALFFYLNCMLASGIYTMLYRHFNKEIPKNIKKCYCDKCLHELKFWEANLPIINYIILKGKCSYCKEPIDKKQFLFELIIGYNLTLIIGVLYVF